MTHNIHFQRIGNLITRVVLAVAILSTLTFVLANAGYAQSSPTISSQEISLVNPMSKAKLWAKCYCPADASSQKTYPVLVLVPAGLGDGSGMDAHGEPQFFAQNGFVGVCFDPDGRGKSEGKDDKDGRVQQEGLHALLKQLANMEFVQKDNIGIKTASFGIALGAGAIGRHPNDPPVKYLIDLEGPSDRFYVTRNNTAKSVAAFENHTTDDADWWRDREAVRWIEKAPIMYLRIQTVNDHMQKENKQHAIDMINAATHMDFGGKGIATWTRINGPENSANKVYKPGEDPPKWLPAEMTDALLKPATILDYVKEMSAMRSAPAAF